MQPHSITRDSSHEGGLVRKWLCTVSSQDLLQLALLADAADESLVLVRSMDREQLDLATLRATVEDFVKRVYFLFKQGGCMTVEGSFTQHCLTLLSTGQLQVLEQGAQRALPSPRNEEVENCIWRMSRWADMAKAVVDAEFPGFLVVTAFPIFALADEKKSVEQRQWTRHIARGWPSCFQWMRRSCLVRLPETDQQPRPSRTACSAAIMRLG